MNWMSPGWKSISTWFAGSSASATTARSASAWSGDEAWRVGVAL